ncbi:hypothetical protein [Emcibacter sp. SYSU 3D8]|uniref:hypothetical protein n=1 Tax=Emcibacter sp. SYSU 3D8 TaxID=3133969 RepID=UPI0031FE8688
MTMRLEEFRSLLDAWGADPGRWPGERREAAEALLAVSDEARRLLAEEAAFDGLLAGAPPAAPSAALLDSVLAIPRTARQTRKAGSWRFGFLPVLPRFAGLAAAAMLGFYIGTTSLFQPVQTMAADNDTVIISDYVFGGGIDGEAGL